MTTKPKLIAGRVRAPAPSGKVCLICHQPIIEGESAVHYTTRKSCWRHEGCLPVCKERSVAEDETITEEELRRWSQDRARGGCSAKRRRAQGHGYTGGTGFTNA